jgi:hypothetical protein
VVHQTYMVHIHGGKSCETAEQQGKCFKQKGGPCPLITPEDVCEVGKATWNNNGLEAQPQKPTLERTVVFHRKLQSGAPRMACRYVELGSFRVMTPTPITHILGKTGKECATQPRHVRLRVLFGLD